MYTVDDFDSNKNLISIKDISDNIIEKYSVNNVVKFCKRGIEIKGVVLDIRGLLLSYRGISRFIPLDFKVVETDLSNYTIADLLARIKRLKSKSSLSDDDIDSIIKYKREIALRNKEDLHPFNIYTNSYWNFNCMKGRKL